MASQQALNGEGARRSEAWRRALGYLLAAAFLLWVFHDIHVERMLAHIGSMNWWWVAPAVAADILSYLCEGVRWHYLLRPLGRLPVLRATQSVYIGLFTSEVTPLRFGEVVRTYVISRWVGRPISAVLPSMLVGRLLDSFWLAVGVGTVAILMPLPKDLLVAVDVFGLVVLGLACALLFLVLSKRKTAPEWTLSPSGALSRLRRMAGRATHALAEIGTLRTLGPAGLFSLGLLALQSLSFWLVMKSFRLALPFGAGAAVFLIVRFGTAIPNAPANVGSYQFFTVLGLALFGVEKTVATGFSVVVFIILTVPLWTLGLLSLWRSGMTLAGIRADLGRIRRRSDAG